MDRFTRIEHELIQQQDRNKTVDTRISGLENTTLRIDTNVSTILAKLDQLHHTPNPAKLRKVNPGNTQDNDMSIDKEYHPNLDHGTQNPGCNIP
jgi:hypothetical protein